MKFLLKQTYFLFILFYLLNGCTNGQREDHSYSFASLPSQPIMVSPARFNTRSYVANFTLTELDLLDFSCKFANTPDFLIGDYQDGLASCELPTANLTDGAIQLITRFCSSDGLCHEYEFVIIKDTEGPGIRLLSNQTQIKSEVLFAIYDTHSKITEVFYTMDKSKRRMVKDGDTYVLTMPADTPTGMHSVVITAMDELNNMGQYKHSFLVLKDELFLNLTSPLQTNQSFYRVKANLDPGSYLGNYSGSCSIDGISQPIEMNSNLLSCNEIPLDLGSHKLVVSLITDYEMEYTFEFNVSRTEPLSKSAYLYLTSANKTEEDFYNLTAHMERRAGFYEAWCVLESHNVSANLIGEELDCLLNFTGFKAGEWNVSVYLQGESLYRQDFVIVKSHDEIEGSIDPDESDENKKQPTDDLVYGASPDPSLTLTSGNLTEGDFYNLTAHIEGGSDLYEGWCILEDQNVPANLIGEELDCLLNFTDFKAGEWDVSVYLQGEDLYRQDFVIIKMLDLRLDKVGGSLVSGSGQTVFPIAPYLVLTSANRTNESFYNLTMELNGGSYEAWCSIANTRFSAQLMGDRLSCVLDLVSFSDGELLVNVSLQTEARQTHRQSFFLIKDTEPPFVAEYEHQSFYNQSDFFLDFSVVDQYGLVSGLVGFYGDNQTVEGFQVNKSIWRIHIDADYLIHGNNRIRVKVQDDLGNEYTGYHKVVFLKERLELRFTHPHSVRGSSVRTIMGDTNFVTPLKSVHCWTELNYYYGHPPHIGRVIDNSFSCENLFFINNRANQIVEVRVCDIYDTCITRSTVINHDSRKPIVHSFHQPPATSYYKNCSIEDAANGSPQCVLVPRDNSDTNSNMLYRLAEGVTFPNPRHILLNQSIVELNNLNVSDLHRLNDYKIDYVGVDLSDDENFVFPNYYATSAAELNITYSYTQLDCAQDDENCDEGRKNNYFTNRPISYKEMIEGGDKIRVVIPFIAQYLNAPSKPPWFLASSGVIHRIDLVVCDKVGNCRELVVHFRILVSFAAPVITEEDLPISTYRILNNETIRDTILVTKKFTITNPTSTDIWYRFVDERPTQVQVDYASYRKVNAWQPRYYGERVSDCRISYLPSYQVRYSWTVTYELEEFFGGITRFYGPESAIPGNRLLPSPFLRQQDHSIYLSFSSCADLYDYRDVHRAGTINQQAIGYPRPEIVNERHRSETRAMSFYDLRASDGFDYDFESYRLLAAGHNHTIEYRERFPSDFAYIDASEDSLPLPPNYTSQLEYPRIIFSYLTNSISLRYTLDRQDEYLLDYVGSRRDSVITMPYHVQ